MKPFTDLFSWSLRKWRKTYEKLIRGLAKDHPLLFEAIHAGLRAHHGSFADAVEQFSGDRGFVDAFRNL